MNPTFKLFLFFLCLACFHFLCCMQIFFSGIKLWSMRDRRRRRNTKNRTQSQPWWCVDHIGKTKEKNQACSTKQNKTIFFKRKSSIKQKKNYNINSVKKYVYIFKDTHMRTQRKTFDSLNSFFLYSEREAERKRILSRFPLQLWHTREEKEKEKKLTWIHVK